jgi:hypothetical protein
VREKGRRAIRTCFAPVLTNGAAGEAAVEVELIPLRRFLD